MTVAAAVPQGTTSAHDLAGRLEAIPIADLVQFLHASRRTGVLELTHADGRSAWLGMVDGDLVAGKLGHLEGREALIAMMHWRAGRFVLLEGDDRLKDPATRVSVSGLVMEVARLEDELERHSADAPAPFAKLTLRDKQRIVDDPLECGAPRIAEEIAAHPQIRLPDLERTLPLAPLKIKLGVASMISRGMLGSRVSQTFTPIRFDPRTSQWYQQLLLEHAAGMRVLIVCAPGTSSEDIVACVRQVGDDLNATPSISAAVDGPSIVRIRPPAGGLISLTFLPLKKKNRFLFQTFARTAQLLLMPTASDVHDVPEWEAEAPPHVPRACIHDMGSHTALLEALRAHAQQLAQKR